MFMYEYLILDGLTWEPGVPFMIPGKKKDCIINVPREKLVVINGLKDYIVVEEEGTLLICKKSDEQQIRQIVNDVRIDKGEKFV